MGAEGGEGGGGVAFVMPSPLLSKLGMMCRTPRNTPRSDDSEEHLQNKSLWHRDSASFTRLLAQKEYSEKSYTSIKERSFILTVTRVSRLHIKEQVFDVAFYRGFREAYNFKMLKNLTVFCKKSGKHTCIHTHSGSSPVFAANPEVLSSASQIRVQT